MLTALMLTFAAPLPFPKAVTVVSLVGTWEVQFRYETVDGLFATLEFKANGTGQTWKHGEPEPTPFEWKIEDGKWVSIKDDCHWGIHVKNLQRGEVTCAGVPARMRRLK